MDKELELLCQRYLASKQNRFKNDIIEELAREAFGKFCNLYKQLLAKHFLLNK